MSLRPHMEGILDSQICPVRTFTGNTQRWELRDGTWRQMDAPFEEIKPLIWGHRGGKSWDAMVSRQYLKELVRQALLNGRPVHDAGCASYHTPRLTAVQTPCDCSVGTASEQREENESGLSSDGEANRT